MSKELEALKRLYNGNELFGNDYELLRKALTPPTADEVCQEMEEYFYRCVGKMNPYIKYEKDTKKFMYVTDECDHEVVGIDKHGYINFITSLPPYLVLLIARFYEAQE